MDHDTDGTSNAVPTDHDEATAIPNTAATEATDAEYTEAAAIANSETQTIHAWSQSSDDDTEIAEAPGRRSWKIPITLAAVVTATAVTAGVIHLWPHHTAPSHPRPAPPAPSAAPAPPVDPDARFLALYRQRGYKETDPGQVQVLMQNVHTMCGDLSAGRSKESIVRDFLNKSPVVSRPAAELLINTVIDAYHPQPAPPGTSDVDTIFVKDVRQLANLAAPPNAAYAVNYAHEVCTKLGNGSSVFDTNELIQNSTIWNSYGDAQKFVLLATGWYCEEYKDAVIAENG